ncbi:hypothetical protein Btru_076172 [Bulinus truncatus]|nr:hypothetical protein Btru_076172 [Bulinus truncatus]
MTSTYFVSPKSPTSSENVRRSPAAKEGNQSTSSESKSASPSSAGPGSAKKKSPGVRRPPPREPSMVELLMMLGGPTLSVAEANSIVQDVEREEQGWRHVMAADLHSQGLSVPSHLRPMGGNCHRGHERTPREPASGADQAGAPVSQETKPAETVNVDPDTGITCTTSTQGAAATVDEKKSVPEKSPQILKQPASSEKVESPKQTASSEKVESPKQPASSEKVESPKQPASSEKVESPKQPASSEKADSQTTKEGNQSTSSESKSASPASAGPGSAKKKSPGVRRPPPREPSMVELLMRLGGPTLSAAEANSIVQDVEREEQGWRQVMAADLHSQGMSVPCHLHPWVEHTPRDPASGADQAGAPVSQETKPAETVNVDPDTGITCTTSTQGAAATVDEKKSLPEGSSKSPKPPSNSEKTSPKPPASSEKVSPKPPASSEKSSPKPPASSEKVSPKPPASSDKVSPKPPASSETASPKQPGSSEKAQSQTSSVGKQTTTGKSKSASPGSAKTSSPSPRRPPQREQSIAEMLMECAIPRMSAEEARNAERKMAMTEERMRRGLMAGELHSQALTALWHLNPTGETIHFGNEMVVFERPQNPAGQTDRPVKQETKTAETASVKPDSGTTSTTMAQDQDQPPSVIDDDNTSSEKSPERPSRPVFHDDQTGSDDIRSTNEQEASDKAKQDTKAKAKKADKDKKALTRKPETSAAPSTSETTRDAGSQEQPPELAARLLMWELDQRNQASRIRAMEIIREFNDAFNPLFTTTAVSERTDESMSSEGETFGQRGRDERPGPSRVLGATAEPPPDTPRQDIFAIESLLELFRTPWRSEVMRKYTGRQLAELRMRLIARRCALLAAQSAREMRSSGLDLVARTFRLMAGPLNVENCDGDGRCRHAEIPHEANRHAGRPCDPHRPHRGADVSGSDAGRRYANASLDFLNNERTLRSMIMEIESEIYARGNVASSHAMAMSIPLEEVTRNLIQLTYEAPSEPPVCLLLPFGQGNPDMNAFVQTLTRARARCNFPPQGLTQSQINDLPTVLYNGASGQVEASSASRCSICLHDYQIGDEIRILPCGHEFHKTCVDEWLKKAPTCPICRERIRRNV